MSRNFVNKNQTKETRKAKYKFLRDCKIDVCRARRMMDWTHNHIILYLHANSIQLKANYEDK